MRGIQRAGASLDMGRLAHGLAFPGIDPRTWVSVACVTKVRIDPDHGPMVDVILIPSGARSTARVGAEGATSGAGVWWPIQVDDEVLVGYPEAEPAHGLVVLRRLWALSDPPPGLAVDNPDDVLVQAPPGVNMRLVATNDGFVVVAASDVRLGAEDATEHLVLGDTYRGAEDALFLTVTALLDAIGAWIAAVSPIPPIAVPGVVTAPVVASTLAAFNTAKANFDAAKTTYLSTTVRTK